METTSYIYKTKDQGSYFKLIGIVKKLDVKFTCNPLEQSIVVTPLISDEVINNIGKQIDADALNFIIEPMEDEILDFKKLYEQTLGELEQYKGYWLRAVDERNAVKSKVQALAVLLSTVFPEK